MTAKAMLALAVLGALALAGCTGGSDKGGSSSSSSASGGAGAGGCVTVGGSGGCSNATVSGSASGSYSSTSTGSSSNSSTNSSAPMNATVNIQQGAFQPDEVTVAVGATVTWEHHDGSTAHTVTADDNSFDSSPSCSTPLPIGDCMMDGDTFSYTFTSPGDVHYHDKLHTAMTGVVHVVQP